MKFKLIEPLTFSDWQVQLFTFSHRVNSCPDRYYVNRKGYQIQFYISYIPDDMGRVAKWLAICDRKLMIASSSLAASLAEK